MAGGSTTGRWRGCDAEAVGLAYAAQRVEAMPVEATDVALGAVATEAGLWRGGGLVRPGAG